MIHFLQLIMAKEFGINTRLYFRQPGID